MRILAIAVAALAAAIAPTLASAADKAAADIVNVDGAVIGKATFEQTPTGVLMSVDVSGLPPGGHGIHLHAVGACTPDFKAATGHINPHKAKHGLRNPEGPDNGDLPNLFAAADGTAKAEFFTTLVSVSGGDMPALLDEDGSAVIIHENPDDHMTQPIGGSGERIGCGVIGKMQPGTGIRSCSAWVELEEQLRQKGLGWLGAPTFPCGGTGPRFAGIERGGRAGRAAGGRRVPWHCVAPSDRVCSVPQDPNGCSVQDRNWTDSDLRWLECGKSGCVLLPQIKE